MFEVLKKVVNGFTSEQSEFKVVGIEEYNGNKLSIALSFGRDCGVSLELLPDGTFDYILVDVESEEILDTVTVVFSNTIELEEKVTSILQKLCE